MDKYEYLEKVLMLPAPVVAQLKARETGQNGAAASAPAAPPKPAAPPVAAGPDPWAVQKDSAAGGGKLPQPMTPECKIVAGKVQGPANHALCSTHGHVVDTSTHMIIAHNLDEYKAAAEFGKLAGAASKGAAAAGPAKGGVIGQVTHAINAGAQAAGSVMAQGAKDLSDAEKERQKKAAAAEKTRIEKLKCEGARSMTVQVKVTNAKKGQDGELGDLMVLFSAEDGYTGSTKKMSNSGGFYKDNNVLVPPSGAMNVNAFSTKGMRSLGSFSYTGLPDKTLITIDLEETQGEAVDDQNSDQRQSSKADGSQNSYTNTTSRGTTTTSNNAIKTEGGAEGSIEVVKIGGKTSAEHSWGEQNTTGSSDAISEGNSHTTTDTVGKQTAVTHHSHEKTGIFVIKATNLKGATVG